MYSFTLLLVCFKLYPFSVIFLSLYSLYNSAQTASPISEPVAAVDEDDFYDVAADADKLPEPGASTPAFLPGEEELEELLERTADLDEQA